jgi:copper resistance protein B
MMKKQLITIAFSISFGLLISPMVLAEMDHSKHTMPMNKPIDKPMDSSAKAKMKMDHSKMDRTKHAMPMDHSKMNHKPSIPVSDGSLDHDVPLPYNVKKMEDDPVLTKFMLDQLEIHDAEDNPVTWEAEAWIGKDLNKFWLKTEGERVNGENEELEVQALYSRAIAPYWDIQAGLRKDFKPQGREWGVVGLKGLAPYFFETDIALFAGDNGRTAARIQGEYELLLTQKTILTPEIELNLYGKDDPEMRIGSGLSDISIGLRLRHEFKREFAPYIGVEWTKKFGDTADFARTDGNEVSDTQFVTGIRAWF